MMIPTIVVERRMTGITKAADGTTGGIPQMIVKEKRISAGNNPRHLILPHPLQSTERKSTADIPLLLHLLRKIE